MEADEQSHGVFLVHRLGSMYRTMNFVLQFNQALVAAFKLLVKVYQGLRWCLYPRKSSSGGAMDSSQRLFVSKLLLE